MGNIDKIRQEIERLKSTNPSEYNYQNAEGYIWALDDLLSFLDTLSEDSDKSLVEAAEEYAVEYAKRNTPKDADGEIWRVGDVMIENRMSFEDGFKAGAKWQKEKDNGLKMGHWILEESK